MIDVNEIRPLKRYDNDEVENKNELRTKLEQQIAEFQERGGKIVEVEPGVGITENATIRRDKYGKPISNIEGIVWNEVKNQWMITSMWRKKPVGYADTVEEAVELKRRFEKKITKNITNSRGKKLNV